MARQNPGALSQLGGAPFRRNWVDCSNLQIIYTTGMEHSCSAIGTSWEKTPWPAVQRAAWGALRHAQD